MTIQKEKARKVINEIADIAEIRNEKIYAWFRTIITISVGLIGILISFKSDDNTSFLKTIFFIITISTLGLGVLFSAIYLFAEVDVLNRTLKSRVKYFSTLHNTNRLEIEKITPGSFYNIAYYLAFRFYIIGLLGLIGYGIVDEMKNVF